MTTCSLDTGRQIELGTATLKTRNAEKRAAPRDGYLRKRKNASGGVEAKFPSCKECGVEFCAGDSCNAFDYDSFKRRVAATAAAAGARAQNAGAGGGGDHAQAGGQEHADAPAAAKKTAAKKKNAAAARGGPTAAQRARNGNDRGGGGGGAVKTNARKAAPPSQPPAPSRPVKPKTGDVQQAAARKTERGGQGAKKPSDKK